MLLWLRRFVQSALGLSATEANGVLVLFPLIVLVVFSEALYRNLFTAPPNISIEHITLLDSLASTDSTATPLPGNSFQPFNPNTASVEVLQQAGWPKHLANRLVAYRNKGGTFKTKSDLKRLYGMDSALFEALEPFVLLPEKLAITNEPNTAPTVLAPPKPKTLDLNQADTSDLKTAYGIGSTLAKRIVKYRDALGGFVHPHQLYEVFGLDSATVENLKDFEIADGFVPRKMNWLLANDSVLAAHPYLSLRDAKALITYRKQHGRITSADELLKIKSVRPEVIKKIAPYLSF